jgi:hypothetical protein
MQITCNVFQRLSSNAYQPTIIRNLVFDFCEMMKNNETLYFATRMLRPVYPPLTELFIKYKEYMSFSAGMLMNNFIDIRTMSYTSFLTTGPVCHN